MARLLTRFNPSLCRGADSPGLARLMAGTMIEAGNLFGPRTHHDHFRKKNFAGDPYKPWMTGSPRALIPRPPGGRGVTGRARGINRRAEHATATERPDGPPDVTPRRSEVLGYLLQDFSDHRVIRRPSGRIQHRGHLGPFEGGEARNAGYVHGRYLRTFARGSVR